jgi:hypothetical protein
MVGAPSNLRKTEVSLKVAQTAKPAQEEKWAA